jgi:predicted RNA-binding Zn ribbon-like protein
VLTGERAPTADPQPGDRAPAPGRLALVQAFLNTRFDLAGEHGETLTDPEAARAWFAERGLIGRGRRLRDADLQRVLAIREGLRAHAFANNGRELDPLGALEMRDASQGLRVEVRLGPAGPEFHPDDRGTVDSALGLLLALAAEAKADGSWRRLKACPGRNCGWVFFDQSRNGSSRWCSMSVCGDRAKSRAHYWRSRKR